MKLALLRYSSWVFSPNTPEWVRFMAWTGFSIVFLAAIILLAVLSAVTAFLTVVAYAMLIGIPIACILIPPVVYYKSTKKERAYRQLVEGSSSNRSIYAVSYDKYTK